MSTSDPGSTTPTGDDPHRRTHPHEPQDRADPHGRVPPPPAPYGQGPSAPDPYGQDPYGQDPYGQAPVTRGTDVQDPYAAVPRNGLGIAALVVGIAALVLGLIPFVGVIGLVAVVLGVVALSRVRRGLATNRGVSITGIVLGALGVLAAVAWLVLFIVVANSGLGQNFVQTVSQCSQVPQAQQQQCLEDGLGLRP